jgi:membrane-bound lytic murein transglycosylase B
MFLTDARVARGVDFWRQHEAVLARAEQEYGVPAQVIVSIIGVETFYGRNTGSYRVIDACRPWASITRPVPNSSARNCANSCCWPAKSRSTR